MGKNKLFRFGEMSTFPNVYQCFDMASPQLFGAGHQATSLRGEWAAKHFGNARPIVLELACGGGEYTLGLAQAFPDKNIIGVDIKGARIWRGAKRALAEGLANAAFLRTRIEQIQHFFAPGEVAEIWITFPDPFLRHSKAERRLTSPPFLARYRQILAAEGLVHLKTDEPNLYAYTLETLAEDPRCTLLYHDEDIYAKPLPWPELAIQTLYESRHLAEGKRIKYVRCRIGAAAEGPATQP